MPIPERSESFHATLLHYVDDKMRSWNVPGHLRQQVISDWSTVRQWMDEQYAGQELTIKTMVPLLKTYLNMRLTDEEKSAMAMIRLSVEKETTLRGMTDRALLEAIYKKLHE